MREIWLSNTAGRIPTVNQLEIATAQIGYNRTDAKLYGLRVIDGVKTVVLLGQSTEANHDRLHSMVSAVDHAAVTNQYKGMIPQADPATGEWKLVPMPTGGGNTNYNRIISGTVTWIENLDFWVSVVVYVFDGNNYATIAQLITLDGSGNIDLNRTDSICVDINSEVVILTGTPSETPVKPVPDSFTQLELTQVYIPAGATEPSNITIVPVYDENVEWTTSNEIADPFSTEVDFESLVAPFVNTKCIKIELTDVEGIKKLKLFFNSSVAIALSADGTLSMQIRSSSEWSSDSGIAILFKLAGNPVGMPVILRGNGLYGNTTMVSGWHYVTIPIADFEAAGNVDEIEMRFSYTDWGAIGFTIDIDDIKIQGGVGIIPPAVATSEIIIPKLNIDLGHYKAYGEPIPMLDTIKASWEAFNTEFIKYNPEIWVYRRKTYARRTWNTESWDTYVLENSLFTAPVIEWGIDGINVAFANNQVEFTNANAGQGIHYIDNGVFEEGRMYRITIQVPSYSTGAVYFKFGTYESAIFTTSSLIFPIELHYHEDENDTKQFRIISALDNTTLTVDFVWITLRTREVNIKRHKKWTHEPHLTGDKYWGTTLGSFYVGTVCSPVQEINDNGRHTEFECPLLTGRKIEIPIDIFEYFYGLRALDNARVLINENSVWGDYKKILASGRKKGSLSIPLRFAIVIDNPDTNSINPKLRGELSDIIYMRVFAPIDGNSQVVTQFRQKYLYSEALRKINYGY